jgi:hypothetical protein
MCGLGQKATFPLAHVRFTLKRWGKADMRGTLGHVRLGPANMRHCKDLLWRDEPAGSAGGLLQLDGTAFRFTRQSLPRQWHRSV